MKDNLIPNKDSFPIWLKDICQNTKIMQRGYLVQNRVLADKDEKDEATPEKVDTSDDSEDKLSRRDTLHIPMVPMYMVVDTLKYPHDAHHNE